MTYRSTKTYGHEVGLSCAFRQWRARSHCNLLHGYALSVRLEFEADELDDRNWVIDFGGLKDVKLFLQSNFDHCTVVAADDPQLPEFRRLDQLGIISLNILPAVGCEAFAAFIHQHVDDWVHRIEQGRVRLVSVEVREHGANSAIYVGGLRDGA